MACARSQADNDLRLRVTLTVHDVNRMGSYLENTSPIGSLPAVESLCNDLCAEMSENTGGCDVYHLEIGLAGTLG